MNKDITLEDLGYAKIQDDVNWVIYSYENVFKILFYKPQQDLQIECLNNIYNTIDMEELQAICNKCKELGWYE